MKLFRNKLLIWIVIALLGVTQPHVYSAVMPVMAPRGIALSMRHDPVRLVGIRFDPAQPLKFSFIVNKGSDSLTEDEVRAQGRQLIDYFLAALTIPGDDLWVNLSPDEADRICPEPLSQTALGQNLLAEDYLLKQLAAGLTYPDTPQGKKYWDDMAKGGNLNKIWIMPKTAYISERNNAAYIREFTFKVEAQDQALEKHIVPLIEEDVNYGRNFSRLRQVCSAVILATWLKQKLRKNIDLLDAAIVDKKKTGGIENNDPAAKKRIYQAYLEALKKGAYEVIKNVKVKSQKFAGVNMIQTRRYFSGGINTDYRQRLIVDGQPGEIPSDGNVVFETTVEILSSSEGASLPVQLLPGAQHQVFTREELIKQIRSGTPVPVKGRVPGRERFTHDFRELWIDTPATESMDQSVELIARQFLELAGRSGLEQNRSHYDFLMRKPVSRATWSLEEEKSFRPEYKLIQLFFPFLKGREELLFDTKRVYPFSWQDVDDERILFSLGHVDSRIKLILQDFAAAGLIPQNQVALMAEKSHLILLHLLKSADYSFTRYVNNMLVVYLQDRVIELLVGEERYARYRREVMVPDLMKKNDAAIAELQRIFPVPLSRNSGTNTTLDDRMVALQVLAGVCFPQDRGSVAFRPTTEFQLAANASGGDVSRYVAINDLRDLMADIESAADPKMICLIDDVGEGIFDLYFFQALLKVYPQLKITIRMNRYPVENNFWSGEFRRVVQQPCFDVLREFYVSGRISLEETNNSLLCPDPRFLAPETEQRFEKATALWIKGAAFFETMQLPEANKYYGFTNYHRATMEVTGIFDKTGVFAHVPRGFNGYAYDAASRQVTTLMQMRQRYGGGELIVTPGQGYLSPEAEKYGGINIKENSWHLETDGDISVLPEEGKAAAVPVGCYGVKAHILKVRPLTAGDIR